MVSKPFKTEYAHEYGGGRHDKDPRKEGDDRWYVPNTEGGNPEYGLKGSIFYKRKNNKITGFNDGYNCPVGDKYKSLLTKSVNNLKRYNPVQRSIKTFRAGKGSTEVFNTARDQHNVYQTIPFARNPENDDLPHDLKIASASCAEFKRENWVGRGGGGDKHIKIFSGGLNERTVKPKTANVGQWQKKIRYETDHNPKGYAGKAGDFLMADVPHPNQKEQFTLVNGP